MLKNEIPHAGESLEFERIDKEADPDREPGPEREACRYRRSIGREGFVSAEMVSADVRVDAGAAGRDGDEGPPASSDAPESSSGISFSGV